MAPIFSQTGTVIGWSKQGYTGFSVISAGEGKSRRPVRTEDPSPWGGLLQAYGTSLRDERGASPGGTAVMRRHCERFAAYAADVGIGKIASLGPETIYGFLQREGTRYSRKTMSTRCSAVRGFLRHLYRCGRTPTDLSVFVVAPRLYRQEGCPRFLTASQVRAVLECVDRRTRSGVRDYAILLLLTAYGLRGIEVVRLGLEDVDWRRDRLHLRGRKAGNDTDYPLSASVGEAILRYLQRSRPKSSSRRLFLRLLPPYQPFAGSEALSQMVRRRLARAGVKIERPGTHSFRYTCAQRLLDQGFSLKTIGDYLGHRHPSSTRGYTRIAIEQLREVALGDGEELL